MPDEGDLPSTTLERARFLQNMLVDHATDGRAEEATYWLFDAGGMQYAEEDDLPALYSKVAKFLNLAPSQHTEDAFRVVLGSAHQIVERLGSLRNKIGDAHGKGGRPVRPAPRHAQLVVNLAGTVATFLVETFQARSQK